MSQEPWDTPPRRTPEDDGVPALVLQVEGFEGPIDLLLTLARDQKVDLMQVSILQLAEQYLTFVGIARAQHLDLAAEYLVMAAWLAYLKSRLLLPAEATEDEEEPTGEAMAAALSFQLRRLQAMQDAGNSLMGRPRLGQGMLPRGAPEGLPVHHKAAYDLSLYELLQAYADHRRRNTDVRSLTIEPADLWSVEQAMERLGRMLGTIVDWTSLLDLLPADLATPLARRAGLAATFVASLELVRQGRAELRQEGGAFGPLTLRQKTKKDSHA